VQSEALAGSAHFAIGAFNANTLEQIQAENTSVFVEVSLQYLGSGDEMMGLEYVAVFGFRCDR
jgi:hypothetical protein